MKLPEPAFTLIHRLNQQYEAVLVGGAVRDLLLKRPLSDLDLATSAKPDEVRACLSDYPILTIGIKHGTLTVMVDKQPVEITTYRREAGYLDRRHPSEVVFTSSLLEDLKRRDFTINALCLKEDGTLVDCFDGTGDLNRRLIRAIGNPAERFNEDALRILRALRFCAQLDFTIEEKTSQALRACQNNLSQIAIERIMKEFTQLLLSPQAAKILDLYHEVFEVFLPELKALQLHPALYEQALIRLTHCPVNLGMRLAALFADIGCVQSAEFTPMLSASVFLKIGQRVKLANALISRSAFLIQNQNAVYIPDKIAVKKQLRRWNEAYFELLQWKIVLGEDEDKIEEIKNITREIIAKQECFSLKQLAVNGEDIKKAGYSGSEIRIILEQLLDLVIEEKLPNDRRILLNQLNR